MNGRKCASGATTKDRAARELSKIHRRIRRCKACPLHRSRRNAVPGEGDTHAAVVLVGEAPGRLEDEHSRPFVGQAGQFLRKLLAEQGLRRSRVFLTNSVKCRPPDNRKPTAKELATCRRLWLERQIRLVNPRMVVLLGKTPLRQVLGVKDSLENRHGQVRRLGGRRYQIHYHPAAGARFPKFGSAMRRDFRKLMRLLTRRGKRSRAAK